MIAQAVTDLYSNSFRSTLVEWLKSIPKYPKPFDYVFEPIPTLLYKMLNDLVDGECFKTCLVDKKEHCLKYRKVKIDCLTTFGQNNAKCKVTLSIISIK